MQRKYMIGEAIKFRGRNSVDNERLLEPTCNVFASTRLRGCAARKAFSYVHLVTLRLIEPSVKRTIS